MKAAIFLAMGLFLVAASTAQTGDEPGADAEPIGPRLEDGSFGNERPALMTVTGDDDPRIDESEVVAPSIDSRDPAWKPAYEWHEDPASLKCDGRRDCETYKATEVAKADQTATTSQTVTGAPK